MKELALEKTRLDGRYEVLETLGRGSYAEIYVARDNSIDPNSSNSSVVIKALNVFLQEEPDVELERTLIENFQNEAVALDLVRHPNVINRLGHGTARDLRGTIFHYLVLEYLPGGDLMQKCKREPLSLEKTLLYLEQVCAGLGHAHAKGVIHRDIKPQNLLLTGDQKIVKIADFGVARFANLDSPITRVGTNIYAAPEHSPLNASIQSVNGNHVRLTPAADVYSLAKTVYALLAGESPRKFSNAAITSLPVQFSDKTWSSGVLRVLERATQNDSETRIQTVDSFWNEIYAAVNEAEETTRLLDPKVLVAAAKNATNFTDEAPSSPLFSSLPNVQIPPRTAAITAAAMLPERPRLVVELGNIKPPLQQQVQATKPFSNLSTEYGNGSYLPATNGNGGATKKTLPNLPMSQMVEQATSAQRPSRLNVFFKRLALRLAVVLLILGTFAGVLAGTINYLQTRGYLTSVPYLMARNGKANQTGWLRSSSEMGDNKINLVTENSDLRITGEEGDWYKVEIVRQGQPDNKNVTDQVRGYVGKKLVDIQ